MKQFYLLIIVTLFFSSCRKEGCTDVDADNYDSDAKKSTVCFFRYCNYVTIYTPSNVNYDPFDAPDLYLRFSKSTSSTWDYSTTTVNNSSNISAAFTGILFENEQWDFEVYDYDSLDSDDLVCSGSFNPMIDGKNGEIKIQVNGCTLIFKYIVK